MSLDNPFRSPLSDGLNYASSQAQPNIRKVALTQRQVNIAVLLYWCLAPLNIGITISKTNNVSMNLLFLTISLCVFGFAAASVYRLAEIYIGKTFGCSPYYWTACPVPWTNFTLHQQPKNDSNSPVQWYQSRITRRKSQQVLIHLIRLG